MVGDPGEVPNPNAEMAFQETAMAVPDIEQDSQAIAQQIFDAIADAFEDWVAADGNLEVWLTEEFSTVAAEVRSEAVTVPEAIYQTFGEEVLGIVATPAQPATVMSRWQALDALGYSIPAGTQLTLARTGDDLVGFQVVETTAVPVGELFIDGVELVAVIAGQDVRRGDILGYVGSSGHSTGPHLHYEVRIHDTPVNPYKYLHAAARQLASTTSTPTPAITSGGAD